MFKASGPLGRQHPLVAVLTYFPPFRSKHESHGRLGQKGVAQVSRRCRAGGLKRSFGEKVTNVLELCFEQRGLVQKQPSTPCPPRGPPAFIIQSCQRLWCPMAVVGPGRLKSTIFRFAWPNRWLRGIELQLWKKHGVSYHSFFTSTQRRF